MTGWFARKKTFFLCILLFLILLKPLEEIASFGPLLLNINIISFAETFVIKALD